MRASILVISMLLVGSAAAQGPKPPPCAVANSDCTLPREVKLPGKAKPPKTPPVINIGPMDVRGKIRGSMMLEFLERANEELERASLESRSFVPELVRSVDAEAL